MTFQARIRKVTLKKRWPNGRFINKREEMTKILAQPMKESRGGTAP